MSKLFSFERTERIWARPGAIERGTNAPFAITDPKQLDGYARANSRPKPSHRTGPTRARRAVLLLADRISSEVGTQDRPETHNEPNRAARPQHWNGKHWN